MPYYAVKHGRKTGIFNKWSECEENIKDFVDYVDKIGPSGEIQYIGHKICDLLDVKSAILIFDISSRFAVYIKEVFYKSLDEIYKSSN